MADADLKGLARQTLVVAGMALVGHSAVIDTEVCVPRAA